MTSKNPKNVQGVKKIQVYNCVMSLDTLAGVQCISQNTTKRRNPRELVVHSQKCANSAPFLVLQSL